MAGWLEKGQVAVVNSKDLSYDVFCINSSMIV